MTLVDSSVWIDYLSGRATPLAFRLETWLTDGHPVALTGLILQEVLQGTRDERSYQLLRRRLSAMPYLPAGRQTHATAANLYRKVRALGVTVPAADALIAAVAIENDTEVLTADHAHFAALAKVSKLKLVRGKPAH